MRNPYLDAIEMQSVPGTDLIQVDDAAEVVAKAVTQRLNEAAAMFETDGEKLVSSRIVGFRLRILASAGTPLTPEERAMAEKMAKDFDPTFEATCGDAAGRGGCKNPTAESHGCPYQQEIHDSEDDDYCNCCSDCRHECAMDI